MFCDKSKIVFSGIQPTAGGVPHLGNYLGALRGYVTLQDVADICFYCVVDQHATTVKYDPKTLPDACITTAAALLASGVKPVQEKVIIFKQSALYEHSVLAQILSHCATVGPLERMTQYKDKARLDGSDQRDSVPLGLMTYPILMAADILLYHATLVPVGDDQHQHIQYAQSLANSFNHRYEVEYFRKPERYVIPGSSRIMSLRNPLKKMSKSDPDTKATVYLNDSLDVANKKFKSAVSEADLLPSDVEGLEGRDAAKSLIGLYAAMMDQDLATVCNQFGGQGFSALKKSLTEAFEEKILPAGQEMNRLLLDKEYVKKVMTNGADDCLDHTCATMRKVYEIVGFG